MLFGCFFNSHFVFVSGKHISFLNACAFGFAVITWQSREVYLESVQNVMHPEKYLARLFGDAVDKFNAKEGDVIGVVIHHFVNEKDGRYFNELSIVDFESNIR